MKIGILTYHRAHNYGAVLQAYALRTFLQNQGHNVEFVDYWPDSHEEIYKVFSFNIFKSLSFIQKNKYIVLFLLSFYRKKKRRINFLSFMHRQLGLRGRPMYNQENSFIKEQYDLIIYGSDQIWRNHIGIKQDKFDPMYFGENISEHQKIISYAVSMGVIDVNEKERIFLQKALACYSTILVREQNLSNLVSSLGYENKIVLDPVFLLEKFEWEKLLPSIKRKAFKYILYYQLIGSEEALKLAQCLQKKLDYKLIIVSGGVNPLNWSCSTQQTISPIEFIALIRDAEYVIATSFHGTAFSIIFEKQFCAIGLGGNSQRVQTLLNQMGLAEHYVENANDFEGVLRIDYQIINKRRKTLVDYSKTTLLEAISDNIGL